MKKLLKLSLIIMLVISLAFVVTGCGNNDDANKAEGNEKSKTYNALSEAFSGDDYIMTLEGDMDLGEGTENTTMTLAMKGENVYMDVDATSGHLTVMYKDNTTYVVSHADKMYMTTEGKNEEIFSEEDMFAFSKDDLKEIEDSEYTTGKETINGTEYEYEEYKYEDGTTERYYFSGNDLTYIKTTSEDGTEETMKVVKLSSEVEDSIFELPTDYKKVEE